MKKLLQFFIFIMLVQTSVCAQTVYDDNYVENPNYLQGNKYLQNSQYSSAINEFKKALRTNPADTSSIIGLSNSYNMRAAYYNNTVKATDNAISDLKSALFFLKYFPSNSSDFASAQTILGMEKNLRLLESSQKQTITPQDRSKSAKTSRTKGEFASSAYDYYQLLNDNNFAFEANSSLGDIYKIFNRPDKALVFYQKALAIDSKSTDTHLKLARTYEQLNDFESALKEYDFALQTSNEREDILNSLERIWQKKADEFPKDAEAHANLGVVYQKQKRYSEALSEYQKAYNLNPSNLNTQINIATLYQEQKNYNQAINTYDAILKVQPYNAKVLIYKADCLKELKRKDEAIDVYKTALNLEPNNNQIKANLFELLKDTMPAEQILNLLYKDKDAAAYYEFAYELHKSGKIDDAIVYYNEVLKLDNTKIDAYVNLSQAYRQKKNYNEALNIIQTAMAIAPNNEQIKKQYETITKEYTSIKYTAAVNAMQSGDYNRAIELYKAITPATAETMLAIASSYQSLSNHSEAINYYKKAMELDPKNSDIPFYIAYLYVNSNNLVEAKKYTDAALALNPANKQAKELLEYITDKQTQDSLAQAVNLYDSNKYNEALLILDKVIANDNKNATAYYYRALCYDGLNNLQKSIENYKATLKNAPDMIIAYYSLGVDYDTLGNYPQAKVNYQKYVELSSEDNDYRQYAMQRIKEIP